MEWCNYNLCIAATKNFSTLTWLQVIPKFPSKQTIKLIATPTNAGITLEQEKLTDDGNRYVYAGWHMCFRPVEHNRNTGACVTYSVIEVNKDKAAWTDFAFRSHFDQVGKKAVTF